MWWEVETNKVALSRTDWNFSGMRFSVTWSPGGDPMFIRDLLVPLPMAAQVCDWLNP